MNATLEGQRNAALKEERDARVLERHRDGNMRVLHSGADEVVCECAPPQRVSFEDAVRAGEAP